MNYEVKIKESSRELTAKERIAIKDTSNAISLDAETQEHAIRITPDFYVILTIHNEKSDNKDYEKIVLVDKNGNKYETGSQSFIKSFCDIYNEMVDEGEYEIECYRRPSNNYKGKEFITCSIVF